MKNQILDRKSEVKALPPSDKFLTPQQLCQRLHCSKMKLRRMRRAGKLSVAYIGRAARYTIADVERIESEAVAA